MRVASTGIITQIMMKCINGIPHFDGSPKYRTLSLYINIMLTNQSSANYVDDTTYIDEAVRYTRTKGWATRPRHVPPVNVLSRNQVGRSRRRRRRRTDDIKRQRLTYALATYSSASSEMPSRCITVSSASLALKYYSWMWSHLGNTGTVHKEARPSLVR